MNWITREKPKIDRLACPWLIKRFIDPEAEIIYVPFEQVVEMAASLNAVPFDVPGVEHTHYDNSCTFDYFIKKYAITDSAVQTMAVIVRGADTDRHELAVQSPGLWAILPDWRIISPTIRNYWNKACCCTMHCTVGPNTCKKKNIRSNLSKTCYWMYLITG